MAGKGALRYSSIEDMPGGMRALLRAKEPQVMGVDLSKGGDSHAEVSGVVLPGGQVAVTSVLERRRNKYGAVATRVDGIRFDSLREARYYQQLEARRRAGDLRMFLRQVPLHLPGGTKLVIDFLVVENDGRLRFIDAKGRQTETFKVKRREVEHHYGIRLELV